MDVTKYAQAGYGCIFVETHEVKRAVNTIIAIWAKLSGT